METASLHVFERKAVSLRRHPRSLSECDVEEPDGDDRVDLEGPGAGETAVVVVMSESIDILSAQPPHMVGGRIPQRRQSAVRPARGRTEGRRSAIVREARSSGLSGRLASPPEISCYVDGGVASRFPAGSRAHRKPAVFPMGMTFPVGMRYYFRRARSDKA